MPQRFPFGQSVKPVKQTDRTPKQIFVLGVYASAVHARWLDPKGKTLVNALAVASEPYIFWRGDGVEEILAKIKVPSDVGKLVPAIKSFNGPSGVALDDHFLKPLGFDRDDAWLCDLVPNTLLNSSQKAALDRCYTEWVKKDVLKPVTLEEAKRPFPITDKRRNEILDELLESKATTLVTLGDEPIQFFLAPLCGKWPKLSKSVKNDSDYGLPQEAVLNGKKFEVINLVHPRQAAGLGTHSEKWRSLHKKWVAGLAKRNDQNHLHFQSQKEPPLKPSWR